MRKGWDNWVCSALRKEGLGDTLSPFKVGYKEDGDSLFTMSHIVHV